MSRKSVVVRRYLSNPFLFLLSLAAILLAPAAAEASGVHPQFNLRTATQSPFPSDRFTVPDPSQRTNLRVNLPSPNCATHPSDCLYVALLNQLDGFNTQPPVSWAPFIRKSPLEGQEAKAVIVQFARGDKTVPNPATTALIRSGDLADRTTLFRNDLAFPLGVGFG